MSEVPRAAGGLSGHVREADCTAFTGGSGVASSPSRGTHLQGTRVAHHPVCPGSLELSCVLLAGEARMGVALASVCAARAPGRGRPVRSTVGGRSAQTVSCWP